MTLTIFILVTAAAGLRIVSAWPISVQVELQDVAGLAWIAAFALFALQYGPMLLAARR